MTGGHLFIVNGDITRLSCDAWLLPTDRSFHVTNAFADTYESMGDASRSSGDWPDSGCLLARPGDDRSPDVWLVDVGRTSQADLGHFAQRAASFVAEASAVASERVDGRRPLVALPVIGSGEGGQRSQRGALLEALVPALRSAAGAHGDVVLVTHGEMMYAAAQTARTRAEHGDDYWAELPVGLQRSADELADVARTGKLVTFLGAGVSVGAGLPLWKPLLQAIAGKLGVEGLDDAFWELDPRDQATVLSNSAAGLAAFRSAVDEALVSERYSLAHGLLASMPISEVVTTNFDDLFELAARSTGQGVSVIPGDDVRQADRWLLKLHGTIGKDIVLTRSDYLGANSLHGALRGLVQALLMTRNMLFVGYGLSDEDFHQLVHDVRLAIGNEATFATALSIDTPTYLRRLWPDLSIVELDEQSDSIGEAARQQLIFLDRMASRSMTSLRFAADDTFGSLRSDDEAELARIVARIEGLAERYPKSEPGWDHVHTFVDRFRLERE